MHTHIYTSHYTAHTQAYIFPGWLFDLVIMPAARENYLKACSKAEVDHLQLEWFEVWKSKHVQSNLSFVGSSLFGMGKYFRLSCNVIEFCRFRIVFVS